ncbi:MAG TPA: FHA domain-containing protein [Planctomycetota bacterium]|jgi:tetratricopeptide (TPR) repeat protein
MPKLIVTGPSGVPREYEVTREMTLGRHPANDIHINEEKASRKHCRFFPEKGDIVVEDLGSSNGTKIDGNKVTRFVLSHGNKIVIGEHTVVYHNPPPGEDPLALQEEKKFAPGDVGAVLAAISAPPKPSPAVESKKKITPALATRPISGKRKPSSGVREAQDDVPEVAPTASRRPVNVETPAPSHKGLLVACGLLVVVLTTVSIVVSRMDRGTHGTGNNTPPTPPVQPIPPEKKPVVVANNPDPIPPKKEPQKIDPIIMPKPVDPDAQAAMTNALAERDRAMASGNFSGAKAALNAFLTKHPSGQPAARVQQELKDTEKLIDVALETLLGEAQKAFDAKKYRSVTQLCTKLLSADPDGKSGAKAKEIMTSVDTGAEARFNEVQKELVTQLEAGQIDKARQMIEQALDELGGTKWAEQVSSEQLQLLMAGSVLRQIETERAKREAAGKAVAVSFASRKLTGILTKVNGLSLEVKAGTVATPVLLKDVPVTELQTLLQSLGITENHAALAYLYVLLNRPNAAQSELERALTIPDQAAAALRLVSLLPNQKNLRIYDFSRWQHQTDWEAISGSWSTQNDRYVLESAEGGDTALKTTVLGGPFPAKNARISFDFELINPGAKSFFAFELGNEQSTVTAIFSSTGLTLHANLDGPTDEKSEWKPAPTHVDVSVTGETLTMSLNGGAPRKVEIPGLSKLTGTIAFRAREAACAIDNIILRNVE